MKDFDMKIEKDKDDNVIITMEKEYFMFMKNTIIGCYKDYYKKEKISLIYSLGLGVFATDLLYEIKRMGEKENDNN